MTLVTRTLRQGSGWRLPALLAGTLGVLWIALLGLASPAGAVVEEVGGLKVGLTPREMSRVWEGENKFNGLGGAENNGSARTFNNAGGNPVVHSLASYVIYWDPQDYYHGDWQELIDGFMANAGSKPGNLASVFAVDAQYTDTTNHPAAGISSFRGAYTDTAPYPEPGCENPDPLVLGAPLFNEKTPVCLTDAQLRTQLEAFVTGHGLPRGMGTLYDVLTPPGVAVCLDKGGPSGHCSDYYPGSKKEVAELEEHKSSPLQRVENEEAVIEKLRGEIEANEKKQKQAEEKGETKKAEELAETDAEDKAEIAEIEADERFKSFKQSFCSYHDFIGSGDSNTILYAAIPWTAGGAGDYHLAGRDETGGPECQDGGFEPPKKAGGGIEKERIKEMTKQEEEEFAKKSPEEKRLQEEANELSLNGPHDQEPNQLPASQRGPDGSFDHGLADLIINQLAIQQQNTVTDPLLNAWQDSTGREVTDECRNFFGPTQGAPTTVPQTQAGAMSNQAYGGKLYYVNDAFNLAAYRLPYPGVPCLAGVNLVPHFTSPNPVGAEELVAFDGMESDIDLDAAVGFSEAGKPQPNYGTYEWNFGDGSAPVRGFAPGALACEVPWLSPCAASVFHSYKYGGTYEVTLTVRDVAGDTASVANPVNVVGPPPPSGGGGSPGGSGGGSGSGAGGSSSAGPGQAPVVAAPVALAAVESRSLSKVLRSGLVVGYSVNEQVAGQFQVLLAASLAHHLGISGSRALGLPLGTAPSIVIGHAILVTTKGGHSAIRIQFSKRTSSRLARLHKLTLMLRLIVHNASSHNPTFATVLSEFTLSH